VRVRTGVEGFDPIVAGGLPEGSSVVLQGPPGNEKDLFGLQFLAEGLRSGEAIVIVIASQSPEQYLESLGKLGVNVKEAIAGNRIRVVDWHSYQEGNVAGVEEREHVIRCSVDLTNVGIALSRALGTIAPGVPRRAVLEVLSPALQVFEVGQVYAFAQSSKAKLARHKFTALFLLEKEMHSPATVSSVSQPFDGVIDIDRLREGDAIVRKIGVLSLKDTAPDERFHEFLTLAGRGLFIKPEGPARPATPAPAHAPPPVAEAVKPAAPPSNRAAMILRIAEERIRIDPNDADALFAKASALAAMGDMRGAIGSLNALATANDTYPGLWVLRAKLFARMGDPESARESRRKAEEIARREEHKARTGDTVPCPLCEGAVPVDAHECPNCGARFIEEVGLAEELDSLGKAAIQDKVGEDLHVEPETGKPTERRPPKPVDRVVEPPVPVSTEPAGRRGMTNGLVRESIRGATGRTNGLTNGLKGRTNGLTNGLKGRTNGLTNGLKGRTNGLTNGLKGRTNGLTNGVRGRTNGITNGLQAGGRTNGLTNGLAALRRGMTNGLTNGNGFTNGLGAARYHREVAMTRWKLYVIPLLSVALLLLPLLGPGNPSGSTYPITIDGSAGDWQPAAIAGQSSRSGMNPNVDILRFGVADNVDYLAFFAEVNGTALRGGDSPPTLDTFRFFIDADRDASTGYRAGGLGADRLVEVSGFQGSVNTSNLYEWDTNRNPSDWRGWIKAAGVTAAVSGNQLEAQVDWLTLVSPKTAVFVVLRSQGFDGSVDVADYALNSGGGSLAVVETPVVAATIGGANVQLLRVDASSFGGDVGLTGLTVTLVGSAPFSAVSTVRLVDGNGTMVDSRVPVDRRVAFQFAPRTITPGAPLTLFAIVDTMGSSGETLGTIVSGSADVAAAGAAVTVRRLPSTRDVGYLSSAPATPRIDGGFAEWTAPTVDPVGDVQGPADPDVDLAGFEAQATGNGSFFFARVAGRFLAGTWVPKGNDMAPATSVSAPDQDRDGVPDLPDLFPNDFNNDGTPDSQTAGDYDGDNVTDYGQPGGADYWLNTTIPGSFPALYANRSVSVYIGPSQEPFRSPDDMLRIFIDLDNSTASGYAIGGVGADRWIEVSGDMGLVRASGIFTFTGSYPGDWSWQRTSNVSFALGYDRLELSAPGNLTPSGSRIYLEIGGVLGSVDTTSQTTRGTRGATGGAAPVGGAHITSFDAAPEPFPRTNPWDAPASGTRASTLLDGNSNAISTQYNHQRKVVRAGDVPVDTACDATNSDGCWYTVFADQLSEAAPTAPSTETITTGSSCGGTFPTDVQTSNNVYKCYREANVGGAGGSPAFQAISAIAASTGADVTVTLPTHAANDILLLLGWVRDVDDTVSVSGWTAMSGTPFDRGTTSRYWMFWLRAASSSETNPLFDKNTGTGDTFAAVITYRGAITTGNPWEVAGASSVGTADPASIPSITTLTDDALVVVPLGYEDNNNNAITTTGTNPATYVEHYLDSNTGSNGAITFSEALRSTAGSTGVVSVNFDVGVSGGDGWGGKALSLAPPPPPNYQLNVKYDFASVPAATSYTLKVEAFHTSGEDILVQVVDSTEATWTTRMTITKTSDDNADQTYTLTTDEYDSGSPNIRFIGGTESGDTVQNDLSVDRVIIDTNSLWDRIVLMRSSDTSGSTWGSQIILASGRSGDSALVLARDSSEPSIAIDADGYLHVVWVSASAAGDQSTLNLVRYTKTTVAFPTQSELANAANWEAVTNVDDASSGFMPTVSTDAADEPHVAWSGSKTSGTVYYTNKVPAWTTVDHDFVEQTTRQATGSTTYVDVTGASLPSTDFTVGRKYLIVSTAQLDSSNTADNVYIQTVHGSTAFPGSVFVVQPDATTSHFTYYRFVVWTAVSGEGVKLQFRSETGNTIGADQITIFKLDLGDLTENTDWHFNENTGGDTIAGTTWDGLASVTFTPSAASNWLVMTTMMGDPDTTSINYESRIARSGEATETQPLTTWEGNDATNDRYVQTLARVFPLTAVSNTFTQESRCDAACTYPRSYSSVFALNLNKFEDSTNVYTEAEITLSTTDFATQIQTASLTPTRLGDAWILGEAAIDVGTTGDYHKMRLQVDNADQPGTQTSDAYAQADAWDSTDEFVTAIQTVENLAASSHTFDLDASRQGTTAVAEDRIVFAIALSILVDAWKPTVSWTSTYTGLAVDVSPQNDYVSLARYFESGTDEIQYVVCKNLATSVCDGASEFTKWDGTAGFDTVASTVLSGGYPTLVTTWDANGDLWVGYTTSGGAVYARFLDYPSGGWQTAEQIDSVGGTTFARLSIGADRNGNLLAMYVNTATPQLYFKERLSGVWDSSRTAIDTNSEWPVVLVRAPNDVTYGSLLGGVYWKTSSSETYFFIIPEFQVVLVPILFVLFLGIRRHQRRRRTDNQGTN